MFEVIWNGVKGFLSLVGVIFTFVQGGAELLGGKEKEDAAA